MEKVRLGDVCTIVSGTTPKTGNSEYWDGDIPWVTPAELTDESFIVEDTVRKISELAVKEKSLKSFPKGTVLLSSRAPIGKVAIAGQEMYCNQGFKNLVCSENIHNEYLFWFLKGKNDYLNSLGRGATFKEISKSIVEDIEIPLPELDIQLHISKTLKKCKEIITLRNKQLEQLDILIKSRFVEMFGDTVLNTKRWKKSLLSDYIVFLTSGSRGWAKYYCDDGEMFLTIKNVKNNNITTDNMQYVNAPNTKEAERTRVEVGDLLISITADLGRTGVVTKHIAEFGAYINQHLSLIRLDMEKVNPLYLSHFLESPSGVVQFAAKNQNGVKAGLNFDSIKSLEVLVPPIELQMEYIHFIEQVDKLKVEVQKSLAETQVIFDSLTQEYFE